MKLQAVFNENTPVSILSSATVTATVGRTVRISGQTAAISAVCSWISFFPAKGFLFPVGDFFFLVRGFFFPVGDFFFLVRGFFFPVRNFFFPVGDFFFPVEDFFFLARGFFFLARDFLLLTQELKKRGRFLPALYLL